MEVIRQWDTVIQDARGAAVSVWTAAEVTTGLQWADSMERVSAGVVAQQVDEQGSPTQQQQPQDYLPVLSGMVSPHISGAHDLDGCSRAFLRAVLSNTHAPQPVLQAAEAAYHTTAGLGGQSALDADREAITSAANLGRMFADVLEAGSGSAGSGAAAGAGAASGRGSASSGKTAATAAAETPGAEHWVAGRAVLERLQWEHEHRGDAGVQTTLATLAAPAIDGLELAVIAAVLAARPVPAAAAAAGVAGEDEGVDDIAAKCDGRLAATIAAWLLHHGGDMLWQLAPSLLDQLCASSTDVAEVRELMAGGGVDDFFT